MARRSLLAAAGAAGLVAGTGRTAWAGTGQRAERIRLTLPGPTGPSPVGTTELHLVDSSRRDPWTSAAAPRELMVSLWYPTSDAYGRPRAPWLPPGAEAVWKRQVAQQVRTSLDDVDLPVTHAAVDAPVAAGHRGRPVVLFSAGYGSVRALGTALVEDLAGHGFVVVAVDHTYEAPVVEFPGGRLELSRQPADASDDDILKALGVRQDDIRFVLDTLVQLNAGRNPDAGHRPLPRCLRGSLDLSRIGMFGHSLGGDTTAEVMVRDRRIRVGVNLDGAVHGAARTAGLDRPFLLMGSAVHGRDTDATWADFWSHLRGWRLDLRLRDSRHMTYTDLSPLAQQLEKALPLAPEVIAYLTNTIGTIDADRAVTAQRAYLAAFFDLHLRGRDGHLLSGPSARYPEIEFVP
ncbi:alpha/beta hydrolase family protein [Streptomyces sp. NPDC001663]|uniref:alpha/beta hydrolase family protein n=1 Tax=Streptomyces sp. NPDC001663 TaxID=3364597 RepID=UPI0036AC63E2